MQRRDRCTRTCESEHEAEGVEKDTRASTVKQRAWRKTSAQDTRRQHCTYLHGAPHFSGLQVCTLTFMTCDPFVQNRNRNISRESGTHQRERADTAVVNGRRTGPDGRSRTMELRR